MDIKAVVRRRLNTRYYQAFWCCMLVLSLVPMANAEPSWVAKTAAGHFEVTLQPQASHYKIGEYHNWVLTLKDDRGQPVINAKLGLSGGMVDHGHGMPSKPSIVEINNGQQEGQYLIEGMLFSMAGDWTIIITVQTPANKDTARFDIQLAF